MHVPRRWLFLTVCTMALASLPATAATTATAAPAAEAPRPIESHDFDFEFGRWHVEHRVKRPDGSWLQFDGTCTARPFLGGSGNVEDHVFNKPTGIARGGGLRAYNPATKEWAIWWIDARDPHGALDPPVKGRFEQGIGNFYSDGMQNGKMIRTRYQWSQITGTTAHWEQAYSADAGNTWNTNWIMEFRRTQ
ncbi:MAG: hypothetical protein ABI411_14855 [Tahibacter sp.]